MTKESKLQTTVIKWLRNQGFYVIKHNAGAGVPVGCPDLSFYIEGMYGFIEVKATSKSPYQALQKETIEKLDEWSYARIVHENNWQDIKKELETFL
jgi:Holliday junction resolvase